MQHKRKPRLSIAGLAGVFCLLLPVHLGSFCEASSKKDQFWEKVDVSRILEAGRPHQGQATAKEFERLIRLNFQFIYFNALREDQFLSTPKPEKVADRIAGVFELSNELRALVAEARALPSDCREAEQRTMARKIAQCSQQLYDAVHNYFAEGYVSKYTCDLSLDSEARQFEFATYMDESEKICAMLDKELSRYFLNPAPGVVQVTDYQGPTIEVLSQVLYRMSNVVGKAR